jgi:2-haloacid dehalogenase
MHCAYKPQPEDYTRTADLLDLAIAECMLVAAHNADLRAARDVGFATAFVPRPLEHGQGQASDLVPEEAWDF